MNTFQYIAREYIPSVDLTTLGKTFDTLEQGHQEAVKTASDLKTTIASLDMNEAEDGWKQQKVAEIQDTIAANTIYGNSYGALDNIVSQFGNIASDQGTIGRLRAQKDYKDFQAKVDKMNMPEDYKDYYKENNPYYYKDTIDAKTGKIIGGTTWKPIDNPVNTIPLSELMNTALKWAAADKGSGEGVYWLDANGRPTTDYTQSATGEMFKKVGTNWETLSKDKLRQALTAAIQSTPGAKESLDQDYKIAKWKYNKDGYNTDIVNKEGRILTPEEYLEKRTNPFFDTASYHHFFTTISYGNAVKSQLALSAGSANNVSNIAKGNTDITTGKSNPFIIKNTMPADAQASVTAGKQTIANLLGGDIDFDKMSNDQIIAQANSKNLDASQKLQLLNVLDNIRENQEYLDTLRGKLDKDGREKFDTYNNIMALTATDNSNKYGKIWQNHINHFFDGGKAIRQYFSDDDGIDEFYAQIGGKNKAQSLGIIEGTNNGKRYVELPASQSSALYSFGTAARNAYNNTHNFFGGMWNSMKNKFSSSAGDNIVRVDSNGNETPIYRTSNSDTSFGYMTNNAGTAYNRMINYVNNLKKDVDTLNQNERLIVSNNFVAAATPRVADVIIKRRSNPENASKYTQELSDAKTEVESILRNVSLVQTGAYKVDGDTFVPISTDERKELTANLRNYKYDDAVPVAVQDPQTGRWGIQVSVIDPTDENKKPTTIFIPDAGDDILYASWNNNSTFMARNDLNTYAAANRPLTVASSAKFGLANSIKLVPNGNGFNVMEGKNNKGSIDYQEALNLRDSYICWNYIINALAAGNNIDHTYAEQIATKYATNIANAMGNPKLAQYYYDSLFNILK